MNNKILLFAIAGLALAGCSSDDIADNASNNGGNTSADETQSPITFNTHNRNITRADGESTNAGLETYSLNFGAYAFKYNTVTSGSTTYVPIMGNFLVGYSQNATPAGNAKGYSHDGSKTWAAAAGTTDDHKSPWFYDVLGSSQYTYTGTDGFFTTSDADKMSANPTQALVYWDHAYDNTEFDCYAPYDKSAKFDYSTKQLTITNNPGQVLYAKKVVSSKSDQDITDLVFKHANAQVRLAFYSDIDNYRVQIVDLQGDGATKATFTSTADAADKTGIVATPATKSGSTYSKGSYATGGSLVVDYSADEPTVSFTGTTAASDNMHFSLPTMTETFNITKLGATSASTFNVVPNKAGSYSYTDKVNVTPAKSGNSGFTFHVTFKLISTVTGEEITVYNARVYVPAEATAWENNKLYTYVFHITPDAVGSTAPSTEIDPSGVDPTGDKALTPIVFDGATVTDYATNEEVVKEYNLD